MSNKAYYLSTEECSFGGGEIRLLKVVDDIIVDDTLVCEGENYQWVGLTDRIARDLAGMSLQELVEAIDLVNSQIEAEWEDEYRSPYIALSEG